MRASLNYLPSGHIFISPKDDCEEIVDAMLEVNYNEDFCVANNFSPDFISRLMEAGFLVMSMNFSENEEDPFYILFPKLHLTRSALFFENLHIKKSIRSYLKKSIIKNEENSGDSAIYELRPDAQFNFIIDRCIEKHDSSWLTPPLVDAIKEIRRSFVTEESDEGRNLSHSEKARPASFALYRDGKIVAGEFGIISGNVYTSYSGFYDESNTGTVQIILAANHLREQGFSFFDLGMPLDYKNDLGSVDISMEEFVKVFRGNTNNA